MELPGMLLKQSPGEIVIAFENNSFIVMGYKKFISAWNLNTNKNYFN